MLVASNCGLIFVSIKINVFRSYHIKYVTYKGDGLKPNVVKITINLEIEFVRCVKEVRGTSITNLSKIQVHKFVQVIQKFPKQVTINE